MICSHVAVHPAYELREDDLHLHGELLGISLAVDEWVSMRFAIGSL